MEITEEQRRRAEANRLAALEKRRRAEEAGLVNHDAWRLFKCRKIPSSTRPPPPAFRAFFEICSPDEFSISPEPLKGSNFPGEVQCFRVIEESLSEVVPFRCIESQGRQRGVYMLRDYEVVSRLLKKIPGVYVQEIPFRTRSVVEKFSHCIGDHWEPCVDGHYSDDKVDELLKALPESLWKMLLPYQLDGVRFGLRRGGRCLIADEMGLGKTIQAIAIACCFMEAGPLLVVCPAVLRFSWAEELERWLPFLLPKDIHLVFGHQNNLDRLERLPKVVVTSYTMLGRLRQSMLGRRWEVMIIDESHNIRCTKKRSESKETKVVLDLAPKVNRVILLSGTPSLSRPGLLGEDKYEYAKNYCSVNVVHGCQGRTYMDFSEGIRLEELNVLLRQTLMIRRLKEHVLAQLPPKRRQIIRLKLKAEDIVFAASICKAHEKDTLDGEFRGESVIEHLSDEGGAGRDATLDSSGSCGKNIKTSKQLSYQEIGMAKLSGFRKWFSNHPIMREHEDASNFEFGLGSQKMIVFGHHLKVLDGIQEFICENNIKFVRIDGSTLARDRQSAVEAFRCSTEFKIALIGITAGGVGLDFSSAHNVVFLELPKSSSEMLQAEDRAHRRGQTNAVNIYIFCAKDTSDESHWLQLNKSLFRVSSVINGKVDAIKEIEVDGVCHLTCPDNSARETKLVGWRTTSSVPFNEMSEGCDGGLDASFETNEVGLVPAGSLQFQDKVSNIQRCDAVYENMKPNNAGAVKDGQQSDICSSKADLAHRDSDLLVSAVHEEDNMHTIKRKCFNYGTRELVEADVKCPIQAESLRFEVSQNTGRVHLYVCILGKDLRPRPLCQNFRPEEVEFMAYSTGEINKGTALQILKDNPACYEVFQAFTNEWNELRAIERNKLYGKPLQLPLSIELCFLKDNINHGCGGLVKGGSKRRVTPLSDISGPLPENAVWRKVALCGGHGKEKEYMQAWTVEDEPLCKLCQASCNGRLAKMPEYFEDLFCNLGCFQEYRIRTSQRALRQALFQIEHGVCTNCKLDCHKLVECIKPLSIEGRIAYIQTMAPKLAMRRKLLYKLVSEPTEGNAWHADHIVPVYNGGGECRLENMRTLCVACHSDVTRAQQVEWRLMRKRAKEQLRLAMKEVNVHGSTDPASANGDGCAQVGDRAMEEKLFVIVPGSAYSTKESQSVDDQ